VAAKVGADAAAHSEGPKRSVFGNYPSASEVLPGSAGVPAGKSKSPNADGTPVLPGGLQSGIDSAVARSFLYQFLARAFDEPTKEVWAWLMSGSTLGALHSAVRAVASAASPLSDSANTLAARLRTDGFESFQIAYVVAFGHAARGDCPLNEIEYGDLNADPLFQPHRLADLAAFYRAFGLEVADGAAERPDHIGLEMEFMSVLAAREAYALEQQADDDLLIVCRDAQKKFLREHLGRWSRAFARRLARNATDDTLGALAKFLADFVGAECTRFDVRSGSEDLLLRPVDEAAETLCGSCGLHNLPPGAGAAGATT